MIFSPSLCLRRVVMRWSVSVMQTTLGRTAVYMTLFQTPSLQTVLRSTKVPNTLSCGCSVLVGPASLCLCLEWNFLNVPRVSVSFSTEPFTVQRYNEELCVEIRSVKQLISGFAIGFLSHFWSIWLLVCPMLCAHMENFNLFIYLIFIYNGVSWFQKVYEALTSKHMQNHQLFLRFW